MSLASACSLVSSSRISCVEAKSWDPVDAYTLGRTTPELYRKRIRRYSFVHTDKTTVY